MNAVLALATFVGVLAGTVLAGGRVDYGGVVPLALCLALLVLARRRWPVAVLLLSISTVIAFRTAALTDIGWAWPTSVAYYTVAASDRDRRPLLPWAVGIGLVELLFAASWDWTVAGLETQRVLGAMGAEALWLAFVLAAGAAHHNWRRWKVEVAANVSRLEHERELESGRRVAEERLQIARELHDLVAHTLTVVGVQLRVATAALDDSPDEVREALRTAQQVRAKAVTDLRSLVNVLRDPAESLAELPTPSSGLDGLEDLFERTRKAGLAVAVDLVGDAREVPAHVALALHRIVQESLTNTVRHAHAGQATVRLRFGPDRVEVHVADDGTSPHPQASGGHGIAGMRERVAALGGDFAAGPAPDGGGYAVRATIPMRQS
jgi:signal transduction histidine kinase